MSRHVWIDKDASADVVKLHEHGITRCYFDARSTPVPAAMFPFERGIYAVQSWFPTTAATPTTFAQFISHAVVNWGGDPHKQLAVHANVELHDPAYLVAFLKAWRAIRPHRETTLVIEGLQGGWFSDELRLWINDRARPPDFWQPPLGVAVLAEAYTGSMGPLDADNVRSNLVDSGVARDRALVMYDAARLSPFWDGCAFTQQRLP